MLSDRLQGSGHREATSLVPDLLIWVALNPIPNHVFCILYGVPDIAFCHKCHAYIHKHPFRVTKPFKIPFVNVSYHYLRAGKPCRQLAWEFEVLRDHIPNGRKHGNLGPQSQATSDLIFFPSQFLLLLLLLLSLFFVVVVAIVAAAVAAAAMLGLV
jgi:hypothetical protein